MSGELELVNTKDAGNLCHPGVDLGELVLLSSQLTVSVVSVDGSSVDAVGAVDGLVRFVVALRDALVRLRPAPATLCTIHRTINVPLPTILYSSSLSFLPLLGVASHLPLFGPVPCYVPDASTRIRFVSRPL